MKIVVTGANGLVGKAVARVCSAIHDEVLALSHSALDITNFHVVRSMIEAEKPDAVINCAAYTNVDRAETEADMCYAVNETGVANLAAASRNTGCRFLTISTDFVFDGEKDGFYTEHDEPNPQSVYGKSKLAGEHAALDEFDRSIVVRTGWIFGEGGTNFLSVLPQILAAGGSVTAIGDSYGTPTYSDDLALRLRELIVLNAPGIYHIANKGDGTSYYGFALTAAELGGYEKASIIETSASELNRPAPRPRNSRLSSVVLKSHGINDLPDWKSALQKHISELDVLDSTATCD